MNILDATYFAPLDTIVALSFLLINSAFCVVCSKHAKLHSSETINIVLINILFYITLSLILFIFSIFIFNLEFLRFFFSFLIVLKIIYISKHFTFFNKKLGEIKKYLVENILFAFVLILVIILVCSPTTDADSLDYHLGAPLEIIRSGGLFLREDDWLSHRLIQSGEMINLYGLVIGSKNFGQIFQIIPFVFLKLIFDFFLKSRNLDKKLIIILLFSFPLLISILLTQKQILFPSVMIILSFVFLMKEGDYNIKNLRNILILVLAPVSFKYSYLIYSVPLFIYVFFYFYKKIKFINIIFLTLSISLIFIFPYFLKNFIFYMDPITPFFEWLKTIPKEQVIYFAEELRFSTKIFKIYEIPIIPFFHIIPYDISKVTLLISPTALIFYYLIFNYKDLKKNKLIPLCLIIFILMSLSGKSLSRFYFDFYLMVLLIFLYNYNYFKNKFIIKSIINLSKVYFIIFIFFCSIGVFMLSKGALNNTLYIKVISKYGFSVEESLWVNANTKNNSYILFDRDIMRTKILHKNNFDYLNFNFVGLEQLKEKIIKQKYNFIVISELNFNKFLAQFYSCDEKKIKETTLKLRSRNIFNTDIISDILLINTECLKIE